MLPTKTDHTRARRERCRGAQSSGLSQTATSLLSLQPASGKGNCAHWGSFPRTAMPSAQALARTCESMLTPQDASHDQHCACSHGKILKSAYSAQWVKPPRSLATRLPPCHWQGARSGSLPHTVTPSAHALTRACEPMLTPYSRPEMLLMISTALRPQEEPQERSKSTMVKPSGFERFQQNR